MKNQYFGDVNDYRKYGLLRLLASGGAVRIGVCWMLTPDDNSSDGGMTKLRYLKSKNVARWEQFDKPLYDRIRGLIWNRDRDDLKRKARLIAHFNSKFVPNSVVWNANLEDCPHKRENYFSKMFTDFHKKNVELVFFDPDNGLAGKVGHRSIRKGETASCKHLFCDEVHDCLNHGFSVLVYQHFRQKSSLEKRVVLIREVINEMGRVNRHAQLTCFCTPDVFYVLIPARKHRARLLKATKAVASSVWATSRGSTRSETTNGYQMAVSRHTNIVRGVP